MKYEWIDKHSRCKNYIIHKLINSWKSSQGSLFSIFFKNDDMSLEWPTRLTLRIAHQATWALMVQNKEFEG